MDLKSTFKSESRSRRSELIALPPTSRKAQIAKPCQNER